MKQYVYEKKFTPLNCDGTCTVKQRHYQMTEFEYFTLPSFLLNESSPVQQLNRMNRMKESIEIE